MYSLMSILTMFFSESKRYSAKAFASSVLPTPVGPRKMKLPIGRFGSERPARFLLIALQTRSTASSCPITRFLSSVSMFCNFSSSPCIILDTGIPVQVLTTSDTSSSVTSSFKIAPASCAFFRFFSASSKSF